MAGKEGSSSNRRGQLGRRSTSQEGTLSLRPCGARHMEAEEGAFSLRPCAAKHMSLEEAVAGDEGPLKGLPAKRKAADSGDVAAVALPKAVECEALEMFPARERSSSGSVDVAAAAGFPKAGGKMLEPRAFEPMAVDLFPEQQMPSDDAMLRKRIKSDLLNFPESAALCSSQLKAAVDRILRESKPETASPTAKGMVRLSNDDICIFFYLKPEIPTLYDLSPGGDGVFPDGWIYERSKELDAEIQPDKRDGQDLAVFVAKIRVDLLTKGYVEVPELYLEDTPEMEAARTEASMKGEHEEYTGVAGPDDEQWWLDEAVVERLALQFD